MATIDIFNDDKFSLGQLTDALDKTPHRPNLLGSLNIFEPDYLIGTDIVMVEKRDNVLSLIPVSERGAAPAERQEEKRDIRPFQCRRIFQHERMQASELFKLRGFGQTSEFAQVQIESMRRLMRIRENVELTWEHMRLGAIQGVVTYASGSSVTEDNWYTQWGVNQASEIDFALDEVDTAGNNTSDVRGKCHQVIRAMMRNAKGAWVENVTQVHALAGDTFFDQLINHDQVKDTYKNWEAAAALRQNIAFDAFSFGGIVWHNYRGTDDNSTVAVAATKAKFFPVGAREVFKVAWAPGESFSALGAPGMPVYAQTVPEQRPDPRWVDFEEYSYPLYMCLRPEMLQRGKNT